MSAEEVLKRIGSQMDRSERLGRAQVIVDNGGNVADLESTVDRLWKTRVAGAADAP